MKSQCSRNITAPTTILLAATPVVTNVLGEQQSGADLVDALVALAPGHKPSIASAAYFVWPEVSHKCEQYSLRSLGRYPAACGVDFHFCSQVFNLCTYPLVTAEHEL